MTIIFSPGSAEHIEWLRQVKPGDIVYVRREMLHVPLCEPVLVLINPFNENYSISNNSETSLEEKAKALDLVYRQQVVVLIDEKPVPVFYWRIRPENDSP